MRNSAEEARIVEAQRHERVINLVYGAGLTLAGILSLERVDEAVSERLHGVVEALDAAVVELRHASLARILADADPPDVLPTSAACEEGHRRLNRFAVDAAFAYAKHGHDFYRASDHVLWAHESDGLLLSARSGLPFARRDGNVFYDTETNLPLYYEDLAHSELAHEARRETTR